MSELSDEDMAGGHEREPALVLHEQRETARVLPGRYGTARIGKRIVTETITIEVDVSREEFYVEYDDAVDPTPAPGALFVDEQPTELILYREEPVVHKRVVPVERVLWGRQVKHATVAGPLERRREVLEVDADGSLELQEIDPVTDSGAP
ncbi:YsnF/AvaK domain-containing protein [Cumulibacter manganitolerans]|uniref:YsnF/AvaK domain-containing protein n=1 Tax=Cumulibacter manganitolerans TaxID=1884992 RepID=UPI00129503CA|nr:YsnF/AvaK domain-containing protein [Cumulibacter manganitolerans]